MQIIKDYIKERPFLYDKLFKLKRMLNRNDLAYNTLDCYSRKRNRKISFIQIGANDGLRNDPIREFILRDRWSGILVEPVPYAFNELKQNYSKYAERNLTFINAAIGSTEQMAFWTFKETYLAKLNKEDRMNHLRKSSFSRDHVLKFIGNEADFCKMTDSIPIVCMSFKKLIDDFWKGGEIDLLAIDAEGNEEVILLDMLKSNYRPLAIFYEQHNLGTESTLESHLELNGYAITRLGGDAFAELVVAKEQFKEIEGQALSMFQ